MDHRQRGARRGTEAEGSVHGHHGGDWNGTGRRSHAECPHRRRKEPGLRIPVDSQICQTAKEYPTIVACAADGCGQSVKQEKTKRLEQLGIQVVQTFSGKGRAELRELMEILGGQGIDSILLEGGGTLNDSALKAGIVREIRAFVAPKIFGGQEAKTPVAGTGAEFPSEAVPLRLQKISQIGGDLLLEYRTGR